MLSDTEISENYVRDLARQSVRGGYWTRDDIVYFVASAIEDEGISLSAKEIVEKEIESLRVEQANWPEETEFLKLMAAMSELENTGIACRDNFTCCGSCGAAAIGEEMRELTKSGTAARGYMFFHEQDVESATEGDGLYLNYGDKTGDHDASVLIGKEVCRVLAKHGIETDWNQSIDMRIHVRMEWQRPWSED